jgi:hypothetical protein
MESIETINSRLKENYGSDLQGNAFYRLVWSTGEVEKRLGTFQDYYGQIYLRTVTEVRQVPKYPNNLNRFVLEILLKGAGPEEVKDYNYYEPLYVFERDDGTPLEPIWRAIEFLVQMHRFPVKRTPGDADREHEATMAKEREFYLDYLKRPFDGALSFGEAVTVPNSFESSKDN